MIRSILALSICAAAAVHATDWPQYRGPLGDGTTPDKIATKFPPTGPKVLWKVASPNGFSSFSVAGPRCFTIEGRDDTETLVAREVATGKELWTAKIGSMSYGHGGGNDGTGDNKGGDGPRSTPSVFGNLVIATSADLLVEAFDIASGKSVWKRDLVAEHGGKNITWKNAASPLVEGGLVYVAGGGPGECVLALDAKTGKVVAKAGEDVITHATPVAATIAGTRQIVFYFQRGLVSYEPKTLKELWRYDFPFNVSTAASPVVAGDLVYCSAGYNVGAGCAKITKTGTTWKAEQIYRFPGNKPLANHWSTPVLVGGHLYGMFQFKAYGDGPVKCVDVKTGSVKWEKDGFGPGHVVNAGGTLAALSDAGEIVLIAPKPDAYSELARAKVLDGKCWTTPTVAGGLMFVRSTKEAACLDLRVGGR